MHEPDHTFDRRLRNDEAVMRKLMAKEDFWCALLFLGLAVWSFFKEMQGRFYSSFKGISIDPWQAYGLSLCFGYLAFMLFRAAWNQRDP